MAETTKSMSDGISTNLVPQLSLVASVSTTVLQSQIEQSLRDGRSVTKKLTIDLGNMTTTLHSDFDVHSLEFFLSNQKDRLLKLKRGGKISQQISKVI